MRLANTVGWALIVIAAIALSTTSTRPHGGSHILIPALLPVFGIPFCILFLAAQGVIAYLADTRRALIAMGGGILLGLFGSSYYFTFGSTEALREVGISPLRQVLLSVSCLSAVVLGMAIVRGWATE